jgi:peroxiredoxin
MLSISACSKNKLKITGTIENAGQAVLYFDEVDVYNTIPVDSIKLSKNGRFSFKTGLSAAGFYELRLSPEKVIVLFPKPGDHITINADAKDLPKSVKVEGSHDTEQISKLITMLAETRDKLDSIGQIHENTSDDSLKVRLNKEYQELLEGHRKVSIAYILAHYNSLSGVYAIYQQYMPGYYLFYKTTDLQFFKILSDSLSKYYPDSKHVKALKSYTDKKLRQYNAQVLLSQANVTEGILPEIELPDYTGKNAKLSALKGKYVLLSFWVTGNQTCVRQNLELKKIYDQYKSRGFEIFQVSFDNSPERWQSAIRFDEIPWISVIDTGYSVVAGNYNVTQLPANYLISKDNSSILGKNLTPTQVRDKLQDLLN